MEYKEIKGNLFDAPKDAYLVHCISADFALGAGIAVEFNKRFDERRLLKEKYPTFMDIYHKLNLLGKNGTCILEGRVCNLVTKERYFHKPTLYSMRDALLNMKKKVPKDALLCMPTIGAGLDRLSWKDVSDLIREVFEDTDVSVCVYVFEKKREQDKDDPEEEKE